MKGIIFNLLEEAVTVEYGPQMWDDLLASTHSEGVYTALGSYPDEQLNAMIEAAAGRLGKPADETLRWIGRVGMPMLIERYPRYFERQPTARDLLLSVNTVIHPEVLKVYPGAIVPFFDMREGSDGSLLLGYHSTRRYCFFAHGLAEGVAAHYRETITFTHLKCMHRGDDHCLAHIAFAR
ncbi:heme NO-binding domain-containing protein [Silvibacterium sp.]|uniref:heme NO-binding domain-containing protein n=1 Tax=Silvibacterium sp. TaxID=1964179 RepID=UPI0039E6F759